MQFDIYICFGNTVDFAVLNVADKKQDIRSGKNES